MAGRASPDSSSNLGVSNPPGSHVPQASIRYLIRIIEDAAAYDVCVYGPMKAAPVQLSPSRVSRVVRRYYTFGVQTGCSLIDFLGEHLRLTDEARYRMVRHRGWERMLMYFDPTGNTAVDNVSKGEQ